ncbi:ABC transporter substrate-binding protein [Mesoaciditoga lauensis]|uniref:ABC transporter substrate-binding protein n=1 Tax=Mesoaciditoga lauensis TaxID=1495039 RepID=UPI000563E967|nr:sugar ABC transporter substrate-binding protein [Mesoaciditoga lauensis]
MKRKLLVTLSISLILLMSASIVLAKTNVRVVYAGTSSTEKAFAEQMAASIEKAYPNINVQMLYIGWPDLQNKLLTMIMAGNVPDIVQQQDFTTFAKMGALEPLDSYLKNRPMNGVDMNSFIPSVLDFSKYDGKIYTLPWVAIGYGLLVRTDYLEEAGIQPSDIKTWNDLLEAAKKLTIKDSNGKIVRYGIVYPTGLHRYAWRQAYIMGYSDGFSLTDTSINNKERYINLLNFIKELKPYMPPSANTWGLKEAFQAFAMGKCAMMITGSFFTANVYPINPDVIQHVRAIPFPHGPDVNKPWVPVSNAGWGMFAKSKNKEAAWKVLTYITSKEWGSKYVAFINLPARTDEKISEIKSLQKNMNMYPKSNALEGNSRITNDFANMVKEYGKPMEKIPGRVEMEKIFTTAMASLLNGASVQSVYEQIKTGLDQVKAQFK